LTGVEVPSDVDVLVIGPGEPRPGWRAVAPSTAYLTIGQPPRPRIFEHEAAWLGPILGSGDK
jgi:hypothetical protein